MCTRKKCTHDTKTFFVVVYNLLWTLTRYRKILVHTSKTVVNTRIFLKNSGEQSESSGYRGHICNTNSGEQSESSGLFFDMRYSPTQSWGGFLAKYEISKNKIKYEISKNKLIFIFHREIFLGQFLRWFQFRGQCLCCL